MVFLERCGAYGEDPNLGMIAYVVLHALRAHWRGRNLAVGDLLALLFVMLEQGSIDRGNFTVAFLYTLLPNPAGKYLQRVHDDSVHVFPRVADQEWVTTVQNYMTELGGIEERRRVLLGPGGGNRPPRQPRGPRQNQAAGAAAATAAAEAAPAGGAAEDKGGKGRGRGRGRQ